MDFFDLPIGSDLKKELDENLKADIITEKDLEEMFAEMEKILDRDCEENDLIVIFDSLST